ncbi:hypothetical protein [Stenomitos frigidus]|uniref:hypothetical protein n=1 Tax=Stenomitos frigidus TaxID=1886765 RepID=UPI0032986D3F
MVEPVLRQQVDGIARNTTEFRAIDCHSNLGAVTRLKRHLDDPKGGFDSYMQVQQ